MNPDTPSATHADTDAASTFAYTGQTLAGRAITGSIQAHHPDEAQANLAELGLRVLSLEKTAAPRRQRRMGAGEFQAFNHQLAHLAEAGFPLEHGLRLVAQDLGRGRLAGSVRNVADELSRGTELSAAFAKHRRGFPPLYGVVLDAGVRTDNLPGVLMGLGRHLELTRKLAAAAWRAMVYPLVVIGAMLAVLSFIGLVIVPEFNAIYSDFDTDLPGFTKLMLNLMAAMPLITVGLIVMTLCGAGGIVAARSAGMGQKLAALLLPLPLVGAILKRNLVSRWCDSVRLGITAGLDMPAALELSAATIGSPAINRDTRVMLDALALGRDIDALLDLKLIPPAVPAAIDLARGGDDLPEMLANLSALYAEQAEARIGAFQAILGPLMLVFIGLVIGAVVVAMFLPLVTLMQSVM